MPCYRPQQAYRSTERSDNGKWSVTFSPKQGYVDYGVKLPCGQCIGCRLEKSRQWAIRCVHEMQEHEENSFITLTFDEKNIDPTGSLVKADFQKFMKRLRKNTGRKIRYFHCGEYGDQLKRPHHHAILFGYDFNDKKQIQDSHKGCTQYESETLNKAWQHKGLATIGDANFETAAYVARYVLKKMNGVGADNYYQGKQPEYITMSRGGKGGKGIGHSFYDKYKEETYRDDNVVIRGKQMKPPKYYDDQLDKENPALLEEIKLNRFKNAQASEDFDNLTRLHVKELITELRQKTQTRTL